MPRADRKNITETALIEERVVTAGNSIPQGQPVILIPGGTISVPGALTDQIYGIAYKTEDGTWPATGGDTVNVVLIGSPCIVPCRVGTAAAVTPGTIVNVDNGFDGVKTMTTAVNAVTTPIGMATQLGSAVGELVGVNLGARLGTGT